MGSNDRYQHNRITILYDDRSGGLFGDLAGLDMKGPTPDVFF
jgi:hypothetical protein